MKDQRTNRQIDIWSRVYATNNHMHNNNNKFGTNNDASWMKEDEDEEDSLLTSKEQFWMITESILAKFTV